MTPVLRLRILSILFFSGFSGLLSAQQITGVVKDRYNDVQPGAVVTLEGTRAGAITDAKGMFSIRQVEAGSYNLVVQSLGFKIHREKINVPSAQPLMIVLDEDPLGIEELVVTSSFNPASKLSSSTAITTLNSAQLNQYVQRGTSELLRSVPGIQVNNQFGEIGADVTVRGLPTAANSSYRYISMREDGLPVYEGPGVLFAFPDAMFRYDESIERMEAVRGGSAAVVSSNTPGGIINFINKTGGERFGGSARLSAGSQGMARADVAFGGPIGRKWRYHAGGFYRYDQGVRNAGFPANEGGQFKANLTRLIPNGHIRLSARYLHDRNVWYLGLPIQNYLKPEPIPGGPEFSTGVMYSEDKLDITVPDAFNRGKTVTKKLNGYTTDYKMVGLEVAKGFGNGWNFTWRNRFLQCNNDNNLLIDVADPFPAAFFGAPGIPTQVPRGVKFVATGESVRGDALNTLNNNGLITVHGGAFAHQPVKNLMSQAQITKTLNKHQLSAGLYYSWYNNRLQLTQHGYFMEVANRPRLVQVEAAVAPDGSYAGLTSPAGFAGNNTGFFNVDVDYATTAFYAGDEWTISPKITLDLGVRVENNHAVGQSERPVIPGAVNQSGVVTGQSVPAGYEPFVPTADDTRNGQFGSGIYRKYDYNFGAWNGTVGLNYRLSNRSAVYVRAAQGSRAPTVQQWTFQTSDGSQVTGETNKGVVEEIFQGEIGYKLNAKRFALLMTGYYTQSKNMITTLHRGQPDGSFKFLPITGDSRTIGTEIELAFTPVRGLQLKTVTTLQDPRYTRFEYEFFVAGSNEHSGTHRRDYKGNYTLEAVRFMTDLTAAYQYRAFDIFANYRYTGARYANRPNTIEIPGYGEAAAGAGYAWRNFHLGVKVSNLFDTQAIVQMANRTGEDVISVNADGSAVSLVTTGANAGATVQSKYTTGSGILGRSVVASLAYRF